MQQNILVKNTANGWEIVNGHRRFEALVKIGKDFKVTDVESGKTKLVQVNDGMAKITNVAFIRG